MKEVNKYMRIELHDKLAQKHMTLHQFADAVGVSYKEAYQLFYGPNGNEEIRRVPDENFDKAEDWLGD